MSTLSEQTFEANRKSSDRVMSLDEFKIIDEVVNGDTKVNKLMDNVFIFILRNIMAIESTVNLTSGFSAGAICYV